MQRQTEGIPFPVADAGGARYSEVLVEFNNAYSHNEKFSMSIESVMKSMTGLAQPTIVAE